MPVLLSGVSIYVNANGNMTSAPNKLMTYGCENHLTSIETTSGTTYFEYDANGTRIKKSVGDVTTTYVNSLYEVTTSQSHNVTRKHIFAGSQRVCTLTTNDQQLTTNYIHPDHLGSTNIITDETGAQVSLTEYTPYGTIASESGSFSTAYKFTGKELDTTGLYYYGARYYDPEIGRFTQADPTIQRPFDPQDLNRYAYCRNNPLKYVDPTGYGWLSKIIGAIVGIIVGVATGNPALGSMAYNFTSTAIDSYQAGYSIGRSMGAAVLSAAAAYAGARLGGWFGEKIGGGQFGATLWASIGGNTAGSATYAAVTGQDVGKAAASGAISGFVIGTIIGGLTYQPQKTQIPENHNTPKDPRGEPNVQKTFSEYKSKQLSSNVQPKLNIAEHKTSNVLVTRKAVMVEAISYGRLKSLSFAKQGGMQVFGWKFLSVDAHYMQIPAHYVMTGAEIKVFYESPKWSLIDYKYINIWYKYGPRKNN